MYNEVAVARRVVRELGELGHRKSVLVLVIDDCSDDGTADVLMAHSEDVHTVSHVKHRGIGGCLTTALEYCFHEFDILLWFPGSGRVPTRDLESLVDIVKTGEYDYICGSRYMPESTNVENTPRFRRILGQAGSRFATFVMGTRITDITCGVRAINMHKWDPADNDYLEKLGCGAEQLLTIIALVRQWRWREVGISVHYSKERPYSYVTARNMHQLILPWLRQIGPRPYCIRLTSQSGMDHNNKNDPELSYFPPTTSTS